MKRLMQILPPRVGWPVCWRRCGLIMMQGRRGISLEGEDAGPILEGVRIVASLGSETSEGEV